MTPTSFRVRLALALGLPLGPACKTSQTDPITPTTTTDTTEAPTKRRGASKCKADEVHERVCGLIDASFEGGGGNARAPHERCTKNALPMHDVDWEHVIDGWKIGSHDPVLAKFHFDPKATDAYEYTGTYQPEEKRCCYDRCNPLEALAKPRKSLPKGAHVYELCLPDPESSKFPAPGAPQCAVALRTRHWYPYGATDPLDDAPFVRAFDGHCCYDVASFHRCPPNTFETENGGCEEPSPGGRPLREDGAIVVAPTRARDGWYARVEIDATVRARAAAAWAREAAFEHASVAAFARLAIDLMIHGAPADLVDAAHVAARDEIRHAQTCYGIASAFGGEVVGPGPLALSSHATAPTLEALAVECFRDGCVNETVAALAMAEGSRRAGTPVLRETLAAIADDEGRHAELSYRILAWALREGDTALRARIGRELDAVRSELEGGPARADAHADHDETIGLLAPRTSAAVRHRVLREVVLPCTEALLAAYA